MYVGSHAGLGEEPSEVIISCAEDTPRDSLGVIIDLLEYQNRTWDFHTVLQDGQNPLITPKKELKTWFWILTAF